MDDANLVNGTLTADTLFNIVGYGMVSGSARGLHYKYKKLKNGAVHTDVWGGACSTARAALKGLFTLDISCTDVVPPGFAALEEGDLLTIDGLPMKQRVADQFAWPLAPGFVPLYTDVNEEPVAQGSAAAAWVEWCPRATMILTGWDFEYSSEWDQAIAWTLSLRAYRVPT